MMSYSDDQLPELYRKNEGHLANCSCKWCPLKNLGTIDVGDRVLVLVCANLPVTPEIDRGKVTHIDNKYKYVMVYLDRNNISWACEIKNRSIESMDHGSGFLLRKEF